MEMKDLIEAMEKIKELPPRAIDMEMYQEGYLVLVNNCGEYKPPTHFKSLCGIEIVVKNNIENVKRNECKINFSDGSFQIKKIFDYKWR